MNMTLKEGKKEWMGKGQEISIVIVIHHGKGKLMVIPASVFGCGAEII